MDATTLQTITGSSNDSDIRSKILDIASKHSLSEIKEIIEKAQMLYDFIFPKPVDLAPSMRERVINALNSYKKEVDPLKNAYTEQMIISEFINNEIRKKTFEIDAEIGDLLITNDFGDDPLIKIYKEVINSKMAPISEEDVRKLSVSDQNKAKELEQYKDNFGKNTREVFTTRFSPEKTEEIINGIKELSANDKHINYFDVKNGVVISSESEKDNVINKKPVESEKIMAVKPLRRKEGFDSKQAELEAMSEIQRILIKERNKDYAI